MKKRLPKKILAAFLAVMMVATSIPFSAITAFAAGGYVDAATDAKVQAVETAMNNFKSTLSTEGKAYSNVAPAYAAYVACQQGLDAYIYGGEDTALDGLADKLTSAIADMKEFTGFTANDKYRTTKIFADDSADAPGYSIEKYSQVYNNVLWMETGLNSTDNDGKNGEKDGWSSTNLYYPQATLLYDGGTPSVGILIRMAAEGKTSLISGNHPRYVSAITLNETNSSKGLSLNRNWKGTDNFDFNWCEFDDGNTYNYNVSYNTTDETAPVQIRKDREYASKSFTNAIRFTGGADLGTKYVATYNPQFTAYVGASGEFSKNIGDGANTTVDGTTAITVVNYKIVLDAISDAGNKMKSKDLSSYSQGGLYNYFAAMDAATSFDPNTYFTSDDNSKNDTSGYAKAAGTVVNNVKSASIDGTNDTKSYYQDLRDAMGDKVRQTYAKGGDAYMADSWKAFTDAYEACQLFMADINNKTFTGADTVYNDARDDVELYTKALNAAYAGLKTNVDKVDTSELIALIQQFNSYDSTVFTEASYTAASTAVDEIKADIWGSAANWGVPAYAPDDDEAGAGKAKVAAAIEKYNEAFAALRIDPDAVVLTDSGRYSLNQAIALESNISDPTDYSNYATFATALNDANIYKNNLATTDMTDYDAQLEAYVTAINTLVVAYNGLQYSFTKIPDGTVFGNSATNSIERMTIVDMGEQFVEGSFTNQGYVFKTNNESSTVKFGDFNITFGTQYKQWGTYYLANNGLDSITINATADKLCDNGAKGHINGTSGNSPNALSDDQKEQYKACLSANGFTVSNLRMVGRNNYNNNFRYITLADGTEVTDSQTSKSVDLDAILGSTDGTSGNPIKSAVFARSSDGTNYGESYIKGDFSFNIPATEKQELTSTSVPSQKSYSLGTKFGAVASYNCQNTGPYVGYNWYTQDMTGGTLNAVVKVVDISTLVELVELCNTYLPNSDMYTDDSWAAFTKALEAAQKNLDYSEVNTTTKLNNLVTQLGTRYKNLWKAKEALVVKTLNVTFNYKGEGGVDQTKTFDVTYGNTLTQDQINEINNVISASYTDSKNYTYNVDSITPAFDKDAKVTADVTYTVVYGEGIPGVANWDEFNAAKTALITKLQGTDKYTVASLNSVKSAIASLSYFNTTSAEQANLKADVQDAIDAQTATMLSLASGLTAITIDDGVAAAIDTAQAAANKNDYDMYSKLSSDFKYTEDVTFDVISTDLTGGTQLTVKGYLYDSQSALDAAITAALNGLTLKTYDIYVGSTKIGSAAYGTPVSVTPTAIVSTTDTTVKGDGANYKWTYSYNAPSRDTKFGTAGYDNKTGATTPKYMITAPTFGFIVKGDTYLEATQVSGEKTGYTVTIKSSVNDKIIDVLTTGADGSFTMPTAPSIAYYTFDSYSNGVAAGTAATVSKDTTIVANYKADESDNIDLDVYYTLDDFYYGENIDSVSKPYNSLVSFTADDAYVWAKAVFDEDSSVSSFTVLSYGSTYSFYTAETMADPDNGYLGLVALTKEEYTNIIKEQTKSAFDTSISKFYAAVNENAENYILKGDGTKLLADVNTDTGTITVSDTNPDVLSLENPIYASDKSKFSLIGTFVLPSGYKMIESGFLMTTDSSATQGDMVLENVGNKGIARLKSSKYTVGNQFVINIKNKSSEVTYNYVAYIKYEDANGNIVTTYGKVTQGTNSGNLA